MNKDKKCILVLGMHRSGTSAVTGVLNTLGIELGSDIISPSRNNPRGYFENKKIRDVNEKILATLDSSWEDPSQLPDNWWKYKKIKAYEEKVIRIIQEDFKSKNIFGIKDPRLCILLPLWLEVIKEVNIIPYFIFSIRNPLEIAESLKKRNDFPQKKSILLWFKYTLEAELFSRGFPRVFIEYKKLLESPEETIKKISETLGVEFPRSYSNVKNVVNKFIDPNLRHYKFNDDLSGNQILNIVNDLHQLLIKCVNDNNFKTESFNKIGAQFFELRDSF